MQPLECEDVDVELLAVGRAERNKKWGAIAAGVVVVIGGVVLLGLLWDGKTAAVDPASAPAAPAAEDEGVVRQRDIIALMAAVKEKNIKAAEELLSKGVPVDSVDPANGQTAFVQALCQGDADMARFLVDKHHAEFFGPDLRKACSQDKVAHLEDDEELMDTLGEQVARQAEFWNLVDECEAPETCGVEEMLKEGKAGVNWRNEDWGVPVLAVAAANGHLPLLRIFLKARAEINHRDEEGCTALMAAAKKGKVESVKELLAAHADASIADNNGLTALDYTENGKIKKLLMIALRSVHPVL